MVSNNHERHNRGHHEKTEPGFFGSLIMTAEHILGKTAGTLPVVGLFISSLGAFASAIWFRKHLSNFDMGVRVFLGLAFSALAATVIIFPPAGIFVGISAAGYSLLSNGWEWGKHRMQDIKTVEQHKELKQKSANMLMSVFVFAFIITAVLFPPTGVPLLETFIVLSVLYLAYSFKDYVIDFFRGNRQVTPAENQEEGAVVPGAGPAPVPGVGASIEAQERDVMGEAVAGAEVQPDELFAGDVDPRTLAKADDNWAHNPDIESAKAANDDDGADLGDLPTINVTDASDDQEDGDVDPDADDREGDGENRGMEL